MYLEKILSPDDVKKLSRDELKLLAGEMREALIGKLSMHGGHCGPNLGFVEAAIALHYVFDSPADKIIYDVSHQSYSHKMLTGRNEAFLNPLKYDDVSGYTDPKESEHDFFNIGHTSTSISLASGLAKARDLKHERYNVIAVIGDGSLSGGEALEGLDFAASELNSNFIVIVNDNDMSIAENHGGLYTNLKKLRETRGNSECNLFKALGYEYRFVADGNDLNQVIETLKEVRNCAHPVVVHMVTQKGRGYAPAEKDREAWHWHEPFDIASGELKSRGNRESYDGILTDYLMKKAGSDEKVAVITAATPMVMGMDRAKREKLGNQFIDVGIAEEHAMAMSSGLAAGGAKPIFGVYSTFLQRTYDQIAQDVCINSNAVTVLVYLASVNGMNDVTHIGYYDIPMIANIPNLVYLAPTCREELVSMCDWAVEQNRYPVFIRVPVGGVESANRSISTDYSELNRYEVVSHGNTIAILGLGNFLKLGRETAALISSELNIETTLINPRYITGTDDELLENLKKEHRIVVTLEDGVLDGGFGEKIARFYGRGDIKVLNYGLKKEILDRYNADEVMRKNRLVPSLILEDVKKILG